MNPVLRLDSFVIDRVCQPLVNRWDGLDPYEVSALLILGAVGTSLGKAVLLYRLGRMDWSWGVSMGIQVGCYACLYASTLLRSSKSSARNPLRIMLPHLLARLVILGNVLPNLGFALTQPRDGVAWLSVATSAFYALGVYVQCCDRSPPHRRSAPTEARLART